MLLIASHEGRTGVPRTVELLKGGAGGLEAIVEGIKLAEADLDIHSVGQSSWPNLLGELQLDAAVMDGNTRRTGAVGAVRGFKHPVAIAYAVMRRLDHEILVGEGAERFAAEIGAEKNKNETDHSARAWKTHMDETLTEEQKRRFPGISLLDVKGVARDPERPFDTTVYLCMDRQGGLATAVSTSGWAWKYPGRLGDSPIIGAGSYADSRYGACACTGLGEMAIRAGTARSVVLYLKLGYGLRDAVREAARDLADLKTGFLDEVTIHAITPAGEFFVLDVNPRRAVKFLMWKDSLPSAEVREAENFAPQEKSPPN
ncbi:MAG: isoaspartyl peptidase/L-asparaginase [Anaerolineales bacterium]|nr:isoaspartyl peptidase/L-asparaginase [Anaerolineales bacterium]